ncbi:hypothetical protein GALL_28210 [mine drainage metagenome]|uniref:DUF4145 domain-containing protein n=1 Tax=mine drainage metagenome TaxID=410659 RepID=A0A1J5TLE0_9ZZZZ
MAWYNVGGIGSKQFRCGHCGYSVANDKGYFADNNSPRRIYICPNCDKPTYFDESARQYPGVAPGNEVQQLPQELARLYLEARNCCSVSAFTASVLTSRKMLMNIAVQQGAKEGLRFVEYVEHLAANGFIPPNGKGWVDHIRKKGNEATHEISLMTQADAEELIAFSEMLLKFIFEFPSRVPQA